MTRDIWTLKVLLLTYLISSIIVFNIAVEETSRQCRVHAELKGHNIAFNCSQEGAPTGHSTVIHGTSVSDDYVTLTCDVVGSDDVTVTLCYM